MQAFSAFPYSSFTPPIPTALVIPTGIGAPIGGYAGDAIPSARLLAAASGLLITHPNVMNGAALYWNDLRIQYVEGYALDLFLAGELRLQFSRSHKIGLLLDSGIEEELIFRHLQVVDACRATLGIDIGSVAITEVPIEIEFSEGSSGASWGIVSNPEVLISTGQKLKDSGCTAIAVVTRFPDESPINKDFDLYMKGEGVDPIAGAEAVISHLLVREFLIPCAHAPALKVNPINLQADPVVAAEEIGYTFLNSVLVGLSRAPNLLPCKPESFKENNSIINEISVNNLEVLVLPDCALGGEPVLAAIENGIQIIGVSSPYINKIAKVNLEIKKEILSKHKNLYHNASNYLEAAGILMQLREGISLESTNRPIFPKATI